ncbi:hypothetical protein GQ367_02025 [Polynucleobacter sp. MWH-CaK5]|uniref:hypothetical protein n=1 Tax=Polynucleobacter sp. MWH-CaK5 TaxID=2689107 RepID=UPI001BFEDBA3|nr:hypothetical protein [Polynucleobacter sp. MWH-CaK5]QWD89274.1 hypothetical protein GQ367_02025 [Polynucleobacter sp. MWH-CaK5]
MFDIVLNDLRGKFGDKVLLSPQDISEIIGMSVGEQANKRSADDFPIPWSKDSGRIKVTIYHLADYIANHGKKQVKQQIAKIPDRLTRTQKKATKGHLEKEWWLFRSRPIIAIIQKSNLEQALDKKTLLTKILKV